MRISHLVLNLVPLSLFSLALSSAPTTAAQPTGGGAAYSVTYFEAAAPEITAVSAIARQFAESGRKEPGNIGFDAFQEIGRPSRFALFEAWRDKAAADAGTTSTSAAALREKMAPRLVGPFEIRSFHGFSIAEPSGPGGPQAVYVVTHVDVFPAGKDKAAALTTTLSAAARKMPGNLWFDVLQVDGHANHFTLVEAWRDHDAFDNSLMSTATREFRRQLTPLEGALYDERLYHALR
jgi:quinol monooxygenase YgiN